MSTTTKQLANTKILTLTLLLLFTILTFTTKSSNTGVMQITLNNLKNILTTYEQVHILFHNPQCLHSRKYVEQFLKINFLQQDKQQTKLGIVDCIRELQLCKQHNLTMFPVLVKYSIKNDNNDSIQIKDINNNNRFELIDQQQFLVKYNLKSQHDDQVIANKFVNLLNSQPNYVIVIIQDYALPVQKHQRITQSQQPHLFYLQPYHPQTNPSQFTKLISSFVNNRNGCWIFKKLKNNQLQKYACDSGYSRNITLRYVKLFNQGKLKKYVFQQQPQQGQQLLSPSGQGTIMVTNINTQQLTRTLTYDKHTNQPNPCGLVYISSKHCSSCKQKDTQIIITAIGQLKLENKLQLFRFDVDRNEVPLKLRDVGLKRVPEILYVCDGRVNVFGRVFFVETIMQFILQSQQQQQQQHIITSTTTNPSQSAKQQTTQSINEIQF